MKIGDLKNLETVIAIEDNCLTCGIKQGVEYPLFEDSFGFYIRCSIGSHYLILEADENENIRGFKEGKPRNAQ